MNNDDGIIRFDQRQRLSQLSWWLVAGAVLLVWLQAFGRQLQRLWHLQDDHHFLYYLDLARLAPDFYIVYSAMLQFLPALLLLAVAGLLYYRQPRQMMAWLTSLTLLLLVVIISPATIVLANDARWFHPILLLGVIGVISLTWLCVLFPKGATRYSSAWWIALGWSCLVPLIFVNAVRTALASGWWIALMACWFGSMGIVRWRHHRQATSPAERQINYWFIGTFFVPLVGIGIFHTVSALLRWHHTTVATRTFYEINGMLFVLLLLTLMPLSIMLLIWRYELWEIAQAGPRRLLYLLLSATLFLVYGLTAILTQQSLLALTERFRSPFHITLLALSVTALLWPGWRWGQTLCHTILGAPTAAPTAPTTDSARQVSAPLNSLTPPMPPQKRIAGDGTYAQLSPREREVLVLIASGLTNRQIAEHLSIAEGTVKRHTTHIYSKLGVKRRTQAVAIARSQQLLA